MQQIGKRVLRLRSVNFFPDLNGYCEKVSIRGFEKAGGSTVWPRSLSPAELVPMFQYLYRQCKAGKGNTLCFKNCYWKGNEKNCFDIVLGVDDKQQIVSAYPANKGTCDKHSHWQHCSSKACQGKVTVPRYL